MGPAGLPYVSSRYIIEAIIGHGGMGTVYRALDRMTGDRVALKRVNVPKEHLRFASSAGNIDLRLALAQEFRVLASLRHPHIISVLDYGFDETRQPYFTMELLENAQNIIEAGQDQPFTLQVRLLVQFLQALAYLHRRGVVHRDLKPDNVLVIDHEVRVLDFGLAVAREYVSADSAGAAGTLAYMAPESLAGMPATPASDLYAFGVLAYEMVAGRHPFDVTNIPMLIESIMIHEPDYGLVPGEERFIQLLKELLAKNPAERSSDANALVAAMIDITKRPELLNSPTVRDSFLQGAKFVGREREMEQLVAALDRAVAGRQGSSWLIAGESGVGKTRLLEELRAQALITGALVMRGQATQEGRAPYHVWRPVIKRLILQSQLTDMQAALLKLLVPDIDALLNREIPILPEHGLLESELVALVEDMFRQQTQPIVLLLEDLHWGAESLVILRRLSQVAPSLPLLIVGSYREEERPNLIDEVLYMRHMRLERLKLGEIADLTASMLGEQAGRQGEILELLQRETEGNIYFMVEVVRALAEEAGQLSAIASHSLPAHVISGGIQSVVMRRLDRVPEEALPLLRLAAIQGRELDIPVLLALHSQENFDEWLLTCEMAIILEIIDGRWQFAHDKLREGIISQLTPEERHEHHRLIAEAIENCYPDDNSRYNLLHYHYKEAGDETRATHYASLAREHQAH